MDSCQITQWCARFIREQVKPGDLCIDATMGNGTDRYWPLTFRKWLLLIPESACSVQALPKIIS